MDFFKKIVSKNNSSGEQWPKIGRDWRIVFLTFTALTLVFLALACYVYFQINKGEFFASSKRETEIKAVFDPEILEKTVTFYEAKKTLLEKLRREKTQIPDPSL